MDVRTIENRPREIAGEADVITVSGIRKYAGCGYEWMNLLREARVSGVGKGKGRRYHIKDVARALEP